MATYSARFSLSLSHLIEIASTAGRGHTGFWNEQGFENLSLKLDKGYVIIDRGRREGGEGEYCFVKFTSLKFQTH